MKNALIYSILMCALILAAGCSSSQETTGGAGENPRPAAEQADNNDVSSSVDTEATITPVVIDENLMGVIGVDDLRRFGGGWFDRNFNEYEPDAKAVSHLSGVISDVNVICYLGTWCSDSKREVPRFFKALKEAGLPDSVVTMIGVDRQKFSLDGSSMVYRIERVPTFIFFRNGVEVGRIVESPHESLERDMLNLLGKNSHDE